MNIEDQKKYMPYARPWKTRTWQGDGEYGLNSKLDRVVEICLPIMLVMQLISGIVLIILASLKII